MSRRSPPRAAGRRWMFAAALVLLLLLLQANEVKSHSCHEVKTAFQLRQIGPLTLVPETPGADVDLRICKHLGPTCCTRKMEESYQAAVRRDTLQKIRSYSFELKYLIMSHASTLQDALQSVMSFSMGLVISLFDGPYEVLGADTHTYVSELFASLSLYVLGGNSSVDSAVYQFYDHLFPLVYHRLLNPGLAALSVEQECLHMIWHTIKPFGLSPAVLVEGLAQSLQVARVLRQALVTGTETLNASESIALSRDCVRALVRMQYCPHCRGLTLIRPCGGYCLNVMRGCLAGFAELDEPWRRYLAILEDLSSAMTGAHNLELLLLDIHTHINNALLHAQLLAPSILATVDKMCGQPTEGFHSKQPPGHTVTPAVSSESSPALLISTPSGTASRTPFSTSSTPTLKPTVDSLPGPISQMSPVSLSSPPISQRLAIPSALPLKPSKGDKPRNMKKISRDFIRYLLQYKSFFTALPELICEGEMAVDDLTCWGGDNVVESYAGPVVNNGLQAQRLNPEVKVHHIDSLLAEEKAKLEKFIQEVQEAIPGLGTRWIWPESGSGVPEGSSDCDDEDGCQGSGEETAKISQDEKPDTSSEGNEEGKKAAANPSQHTATIRPWKERPKGDGCTVTTSSALLSIALFLLVLQMQWNLL